MEHGLDVLVGEFIGSDNDQVQFPGEFLGDRCAMLLKPLASFLAGHRPELAQQADPFVFEDHTRVLGHCWNAIVGV